MAKRLGLPKDSLRMAPAELLPEVLGVPLGSATPLALANPSASSVVLLLDARFQQQQHLLGTPADQHGHDSHHAGRTGGVSQVGPQLNHPHAPLLALDGRLATFKCRNRIHTLQCAVGQ